MTLGLPSLLAPQEGEWNDPRVLGMVREAREVRHGMVLDSTLRSYSSNARGRVYFYLDREDTGERILVKTDQIALEVYWRAPDQFKQRIVGLRDRKSLPTNIHYHLDHLVVVQDEFGDRIRIGDGDEVESVLHPVAPGSEGVYDFLLADSVSLELPSTADTVRVYEIQVRPRDFDAPGFVGTVFLDRAGKSIVRMSFTFTPASYVDEYLDHISISLENGLWMGKHWLPYRQQLEIRREVPFLDFPAGSVIRGSFQVRDYEINPPLPSTLFMGRTITAAPESARKSFPFEEELFAELDDEGLEGFRPPPEMEEIRGMALSMAKDRYLSGLGPTRLFLPPPAISSALRYNRTEGLYLGGGISHSILPAIGVSAYGGYSFGRERPTLVGRVHGGERHPGRALQAHWNRPVDLQAGPGISGVLNTLGSALFQEDFTDLYFTTGILATGEVAMDRLGIMRVEGRLEEHRAGRNEVSSDPEESGFRPVIRADEGRWASLEIETESRTPWPGMVFSARGLLGRFHDETFGSLAADLRFRHRWLVRGTELQAHLGGGSLFGEPPVQALRFLGGRMTVPGYPYRSRVGDRYWLGRGEASADLIPPFLRLRAFGAAGGVRSGDLSVYDGLLPPEAAEGESSFLVSAGLGVSLGWDVIRLDVARGLRSGGEWELILWVKRDFWPWL